MVENRYPSVETWKTPAGETYYYDPRTKESTWLNPEDNLAIRAPDKYVSDEELGDPWQIFTTDKGETYYYNKNTGQSSWDKSETSVPAAVDGGVDDNERTDLYRFIVEKARNKAIDELSKSFRYAFWRDYLPLNVGGKPFSGLAQRLPDIFLKASLMDFKAKLKNLNEVLSGNLSATEAVAFLQFFLDFAARARAAKLELLVGIEDPTRRTAIHEAIEKWDADPSPSRTEDYSKVQQKYAKAVIRGAFARDKNIINFQNERNNTRNWKWIEDSKNEKIFRELAIKGTVIYNAFLTKIITEGALHHTVSILEEDFSSPTKKEILKAQRLPCSANNLDTASRNIWNLTKKLGVICKFSLFVFKWRDQARLGYPGRQNLKRKYEIACSAEGACTQMPCMAAPSCFSRQPKVYKTITKDSIKPIRQ